jgi:hypothetical protein
MPYSGLVILWSIVISKHVTSLTPAACIVCSWNRLVIHSFKMVAGTVPMFSGIPVM